MIRDRLFTLVKTNNIIITLAVITSLIIVFGGIAIYAVEHGHAGSNITNLIDALW
jgi:uncharacterized membrane protein